MSSCPPAPLEEINTLDPNPAVKKTVLLLHGLGADCESWPWQLTALSQAGYRPIALDLPGFGKSPCYSGLWTVARTAAAVERFALAAGLTRFSLAGISMGGTVALQLALTRPDLVERLILINTFARLKPKSLGQATYFLRRFMLVSAGDRAAQAEFVAWRIFPHADQQDLRDILKVKVLEADPRVYQEAMLSLALFGASRRLAGISAPTLVISGADDTTVEIENQTAMAKSIPGARQVIIAGGGHAVTIDHGEQVNAAMLEFLRPLNAG